MRDKGTYRPQAPEALRQAMKVENGKQKWSGYIQLGLLSQGNKAKQVKKVIASLLVLATEVCASLHAADSTGIGRFSCT